MKKFKLISLTTLSLASVAGLSMAIVSCGDSNDAKTEAVEIKDLKALVVGTTEVKEKTISAKTTLKAGTDVSTWTAVATAVTNNETLKTLVDAFNGAVDTGAKFKADATFITDMTVTHDATAKTMTLTNGDYKLVITYTFKAVTEATEITALKALVVGTTEVNDKTVSATAELKVGTDVSGWTTVATAVKDDATLKTLIDAFNGSIDTGAKFKADSKFIKGMKVAHDATAKTMTLTNGDYKLVITYTFKAVTEATEITALKALVVGTTEVNDKTVSATAELKVGTDVSTWTTVATAVTNNETLKTLVDAFNGAVDTGAKFKADATFITDMTVTHDATAKTMTLTNGDYKLVITYTFKAVTEATEITALKALVVGTTEVNDKTVSATAELKVGTDVSTWTAVATAVTNNETLKTLVDAFNGAVDTGAKFKADATFITDMTVTHDATAKTMTLTNGDYKLVITYTVKA